MTVNLLSLCSTIPTGYREPWARTDDVISVSPLPLPSPVPSTLHLLLDAALASSADPYAVHLTSSSSTIFLKGTDIKTYLESIVSEASGVRVVDFSELKSAAPAEKPAAA